MNVTVTVYNGPERFTFETCVTEDVSVLYFQLQSLGCNLPPGAEFCFSTVEGNGCLAQGDSLSTLPDGAAVAVLPALHSFWGVAAPSSIDDSPWLTETAHELTSSGCCTRVLTGNESVHQPCFTHAAGTQLLCAGCASTCVPPGHTQPSPSPSPFLCSCPPSSCLFSPRFGAECGVGGEAPHGSALAGRVRRALALQADSVMARAAGVAVEALAREATSPSARSMVSRIVGGADHMREFQRPEFIRKARRIIPVARLFSQACEAFDREAGPWPSPSPPGGPTIAEVAAARCARWRDCLLAQLVTWFKGYFAWANNAPCSACGSPDTTSIGGAAPTPLEASDGGASMVELYRCTAPACGAVTRFPRYNNPGTLLETRRGRCGEWANAFTGCCLALGFEARHVHDWTDHVWTEVYSEWRGTWVHVDSCEAAIDAPLLYEVGWGKKLSYVIAHGVDECVDVSRRYTRDWVGMTGRRGLAEEGWLGRLLRGVDARQRATAGRGGAVPAARAGYLALRHYAEERQLQAGIAWVTGQGEGGGEGLGGRISGALEWRAARGELGPGGSAVGPPITPSPFSLLSPAPCDIVCAGWSDVDEGWGGVEGGSSWGDHALAIRGNAAVWRAMKGGRGWSPVRILSHEEGGEWPPHGHSLVGIACHTMRVAMYALTRDGKGHYAWYILLNIDSAQGTGTGVWQAAMLGAVLLPPSPTPSPTLPMAVCGDALALLYAGSLYSLPRVAWDGAVHPTLSVPSPRVECLCSTRSGLLLGWQREEEGGGGGGGGQVVLLAGVGDVAGPAVAPLSMRPAVCRPLDRVALTPPSLPLASWVGMVRVGWPSESMGRAHALTGEGGVWDGRLSASTCMPPAPGLYEARAYAGPAFSSPLLAISPHACAVLGEGQGQGEHRIVWVPLCPAKHVASLLTGPSSSCIYATSHAGARSVCHLTCARALGVAGLRASGAAGLELRAGLILGRQQAPTAGQPTGATGPTDAQKELVKRLFIQLTVGCGAPAGTCPGLHCAHGKGRTPLPPSLAAAQAISLAAAPRGGLDALCTHT